MQAIVLVGGEGTRLRPLTYGTPKPMVPIMNVPFLERTLVRIQDAGITHAILPAGYLPEAISSYFGDGSRLGMRLTYVIEETPLGTAGAIKNVEQYIDGPFFVFNGDVLTGLDLRGMMQFHAAKGGVGSLHLITVEDPSSFGAVVHDADGRISAFVEKPQGPPPSHDVNAGTYLLEPAVLAAIPGGRNVSIERETFPELIARGEKLYAYVTDDYWIDLGRPEHYLDAHRHLFEGAIPLELPLGRDLIAGPGSAQPPGTLVAPVFIGEGVTVEEGACVGPYVVLGNGCRIASGARVVDSLLWEDVYVGPDARIEWAIVASRAQIGAGAYVRPKSVIGHDVMILDGSQLPEGSRVVAEGVTTG
ncbi:MAG: NDP-sugar synthase [Candidatus Eremiobacteraeota bacterium]|nr:NDP-sugar synthase [Candidatus Eremiobacteraeota bacterium]